MKKPLLAVRRIVESGNRVNFGPRIEDNYIEHIISGDRIPLRQKGGTYVIDGKFPDTGDIAEVTVDSGAEDSVCPLDWGKQFGLKTNVDKVKFRAANGTVITHHGDREVAVGSPF